MVKDFKQLAFTEQNIENVTLFYENLAQYVHNTPVPEFTDQEVLFLQNIHKYWLFVCENMCAAHNSPIINPTAPETHTVH